MSMKMRLFVLVSVVMGVLVTTVQCFAPHSAHGLGGRGPLSIGTATTTRTTATTTTTTTRLSMVFDFFQKRSQEGVEQLSILSKAASRGNFGQGLQQVAAYTAETNAAFAGGLALSRDRLLTNLENFINTAGKNNNDEDLLEEFRNVLLQADLGMATADDICQEAAGIMAATGRRLSRDDFLSILRGKLVDALQVNMGESSSSSSSSGGQITFSDDPNLPTVLFIMGANGMGKTTTIGKLAHRLKTEGNQTVLVAACDTFRAGAVEQVQQWADRAGVECYAPTELKSTPSAVLYGALDYALERGDIDTVLVDTSGRLSNNQALTMELKKMKQVIQKRLSVETDPDTGKPRWNLQVPHETLLVIDAAQGRMAYDSAKVWMEEIGLTGLILTKLDGSARGGSVVAVSRELNLPVKLVGVGEGMNDLRDFEPQAFVNGLLGINDDRAGKKEGALLAARLKELQQDRNAAAAAKAGVVASARSRAVVGDDVITTTTTHPKVDTTPVARGPLPKPNRNKKRKKKGGR